MRKFFRTFFAVLCGSLVSVLLLFFILLGLAGSLRSPSEPVMPEKAVLHIDMAAIELAEQTVDNPLAVFSGEEERNKVGILDAVNALNAAATDPQIRFVYLKPDATSAGIAHIEKFAAPSRTSRPAATSPSSPGRKAATTKPGKTIFSSRFVLPGEVSKNLGNGRYRV